MVPLKTTMDLKKGKARMNDFWTTTGYNFPLRRNKTGYSISKNS